MKRQHSWVFLAWIALIQLVVIMVLVPGNFIDGAIEREAVLVQAMMGLDTYHWMHSTAQAWVQSSLMDSGVYQTVYDHLIPTAEQKARGVGMQGFGEGWFAWVHTRLDALVRVILLFYARCALLMLWLPYALILLVPALFDGFVTRKIKQTNFDYASPIVHRYGIRGLSVLVLGLFVVFFAPVPVPPLLIPVVMMACCVLVGVVIGNLQKKV